ncbi:MAG TPA: folate-binding protein [Candidatus Handelsmanbacteria bacterium]|nr:folate-binding protein [Candidatus Handelsmanbacteria bacterium]
MTTTIPRADPDEYRAFVEGMAFSATSSHGRVRLTGSEHLDFLHRLSTNDALGCPVGKGLRTVFCDPKGRIVEVAELCRVEADETYAFVGRGGAVSLIEWLDRYHFSEQIEWQDETGQDSQIEVLGAQAATVCADILGLDVAKLPTFACLSRDGLKAMRIERGSHTAVRVWGADIDTVVARLTAAGALPMHHSTYEVLRVEWGVPASAELTLEHNPWEAGLGDAIRMNKGCYTGQEVVARLDTYKKVKQHLVGLRLDGPVAPGATVEVQGRGVGAITSVAESPTLGVIGLGYVRTAHCNADTPITVSADEHLPTSGRISQLPFPS